ncbi:SRPBCC domain-containing protein [Stappia sp. MMSF_3263]|uniref:SRPBCC family protein n=1 Tax=Stappia sp. MMSF_3263 TaxID=3046693 RepID=UPI00273DB67A|nr:SRPBCC domain-containing protein [Stappia sp. MMSF_3263]
MNDAASQTRTVVVEREIAHPPERIWRALTQPHLVGEWLMKGDFRPEVGHKFDFRFEWGAIDCEILDVEAERAIAYSWGDHELKTVVTWTLTPTAGGTRLRMEQTGFRTDQPRYFGGARAGWPRFFDNLEKLLERLD